MTTDNGIIIVKKVDFLKQQIDKQIHGFQKRANHNRFYATVIKVLVIILGFGITVLPGWKLNDPLNVWFRNIALVLGAGVTLLTAWDAFFNSRALWVRYTIYLYLYTTARAEI